MNYYLVEAKFGHVGRRKYIEKVVAVKAISGKEAAHKVRIMPRAKHHLKDAINNVKKVTLEEYLIVKKINDNDMYFKVQSKQEQLRLCIDLNIKDYQENKEYHNRSKEIIQYKIKKQKEFIKSLRCDDYELEQYPIY